MGEAADDILEGAVCQVCGEWMEDLLDGFDPPGHPRTCEGCGGPRLPRYSPCQVEEPEIEDLPYNGQAVLQRLGKYPHKIYNNKGSIHLKFFGRFNYWPRRQKWHDSLTNEKGKGEDSFLQYVEHKVKTLKLK